MISTTVSAETAFVADHIAITASVLESRAWPAEHEFVGEHDDRFCRQNGHRPFRTRIFTMFEPGSVKLNG